MDGHRLGVLLWIFVCVLDGVAGNCLAGKYGYMCSYTCHCPLVNCNTTSGCQPPHCSKGWSGPTCQKENIALNKTTTSSDGYNLPSSNAVNGDMRGDLETRCILSAHNDASIRSAWWRVDLGQKTLIHDVIIYFRTNYKVRRNGIQIYIADTAASPTDGVNCYIVKGKRDGTGIPDVLTVPCSLEGRYLVLYTTTVNTDGIFKMPIMDFCEVEVNVCGPGTFGTNCSNYCHCEGKSCNSVNGVCPSGVCLPGWKMDKCDTVCDGGSYGTNCTQSCSNRNCKVDSSSCNQVNGKCPGDCKAGWAGTDCTQVCGPGTFGTNCSNYCYCEGKPCNSVSGVCPNGVCLPGWKMDKCDTVCDGGSYGTNCTQSCSNRNCKVDSSSCNHVNGKCPGDCKAGWAGTDCTQECVHFYGEGCAHQCSSRYCNGTSSCNHVTGQCEIGCRPGWKNIDCTVACIQGLEYGAGCGGNCSARMCEGGTGTCPRDTGRCESGCQSGWKGEDCSTVCIEGDEYGAGCKGNCSARMCEGGSGTCPTDTGRCVSGCQSGWKGEDCSTVCSPGTYGANCTGKCGQCRDSKTCHHVNGTCPSGCFDGWTGHHCKQAIVISPVNNASAIAGSIVAVLAVVAIVVVVVVLLRRRKSLRKPDNHTDMLQIHKDHMSDKGLDNPAQNGVVEEDDVDDNAEDHNATYYNIASAPAVTVVSVDRLGERIVELQGPAGGFQAEYQKLSNTFSRTYNDSQLEENKGKNKYISYYPYDATRVVLKEVPDQPGSDYINASYIDGCSQPRAYIAAQAPNAKTLTDFWRMIWEQNCTRIVMLTNLTELGRVKCEAYWSDTSDMRVGDFVISVTDCRRRADWVVREVQVTEKRTNTSRCFHHFHFTTWPDHGTPDETALTEFLWLVRMLGNTQHDPLLVHCSAGVGRTGTYIAVDYLLDQALAEDRVDVFGCVSRMRDQRKGMIQTKEQYTCVYMALYETLEFGNTAISAEEFRSNRNVKGTFSTGRMSITKFIEALNTQREEQSKGPSVKGRVWINGRSDILAVSLRSYLSVNGYLLTEAPSVTTASLFWKLTEEQESSTVIVLPDSHQSLSSLVPSPGDSLDLGSVNIRCSTEVPINTDITLLNIHREMENAPTALVRVYVLNILPRESPSTFLELLEQVDRHTDVNPNTVTVVYSDGGRQNGAMLCILSNIIQGLKHDKRVEIYNNMRSIAHCLDHDITQADVAQCYDMASAYIESQNIYANM